MTIQYLGTAAAEGIPCLFCYCDVCRQARELGGKEIRTRSQAVVDGRLLIDLCPDTYTHCVTHGVDLTRARNCIITHVHEDHFYPNELRNLRRGFSHVPESTPPFTLWGSEDLLSCGGEQIAYAGPHVAFRSLPLFEKTVIDGYTVTALKANHGTPDPRFYIVEKEGKALMYAQDTGLFPEQTWSYLEAERPHLDLVTFDCTGGNHEELDYPSHMCTGRILKVHARMTELGLIDGSTRCIFNHFSHNGKDVLYRDLSREVEKYGFEVSYDGMTVEF